ncbi:MAG: methyltransferase domain-containing protein [Melioribacteraceae bacterium]|nr:methyltransferase domain-containing protein [Melioribacteraceae bacterium]
MTIWNEKFSQEEYLYGKEPNEFFKIELSKLKPGNILFLGEGEGRNAVYAAKLGWNVDAVDSSEVGKTKALKLAEESKVRINYFIDDVFSFDTDKKYDALVLIYFHVDDEKKERLHEKVLALLKENGVVIMEAFEKEQIKNNSGGPKNVDMLYDLQTIAEDFIELEFEKLAKEIVDLNEGKGHLGKAVVVRFVGKKI